MRSYNGENKVSESALPAGSHWFGQHHPGRVGSLEEALLVDPSGDLSDQDRSHSFRAKLLVNAQIIYFHHFLNPNICKEKKYKLLATLLNHIKLGHSLTSTEQIANAY